MAKNLKNEKLEPPHTSDGNHIFNDFNICTWNVLTLNKNGKHDKQATNQLAIILKKYKIDILALQEMRWSGSGCKEMRYTHKKYDYDIYYSGDKKGHKFGVGFAIAKKISPLVSNFTAINKYMATIRLQIHSNYITLICGHAPTAKRDNDIKEHFYENLENIYDRCSRSDIKIVLGDFNAQVGRENVFGLTVGKLSFHESSTNNGMRLIDFAAARNMIISSTNYPSKGTWKSRKNVITQIDHILVDATISSMVLDVKSIVEADIDSDHFLVAAKFDFSNLQLQSSSTNFMFKLEKVLKETLQLDDQDAVRMHLISSISKHDHSIHDCPPTNSKEQMDKRLTSNAAPEEARKTRETTRKAKCLKKCKIRKFERNECEQVISLLKLALAGPLKIETTFCQDEMGNFQAPSLEEIKVILPGLKNINMTFDTNADMIYVKRLLSTIRQIWSTEHLPNAETSQCNYPNIIYNLLSRILIEILKPIANKKIGVYQYGFRFSKSTTDQIFTVRQILEKTRDYKINTYFLFVKFKVDFQQQTQQSPFAVLSKFDIPPKIIQLCEMLLKNTQVATDQSKVLAKLVFNIVLEDIIQTAFEGRLTHDTIYKRNIMLLAYFNNLTIVGRTLKEVTESFEKLQREAIKFGFIINPDQCKLMASLFSNSPKPKKTSSVVIGNYNFEIVENFIYLGALINNNNNFSLEIKRRIVLANNWYYLLNKQMQSRYLSKHTKLMLYKNFIQPVLIYGCKSWILTEDDKKNLEAFEHKILRKIFGPKERSSTGDCIRSRNMKEFYEVFEELDIVERIQIQRLNWLDDLQRMATQNQSRKAVFDKPLVTRAVGRIPRWINQVEGDLDKLGYANWQILADNMNDWDKLL